MSVASSSILLELWAVGGALLVVNGAHFTLEQPSAPPIPAPAPALHVLTFARASCACADHRCHHLCHRRYHHHCHLPCYGFRHCDAASFPVAAIVTPQTWSRRRHSPATTTTTAAARCAHAASVNAVVAPAANATLTVITAAPTLVLTGGVSLSRLPAAEPTDRATATAPLPHPFSPVELLPWQQFLHNPSHRRCRRVASSSDALTEGFALPPIRAL